MLEFYVRSIPPLYSKDFQLLWSSYIGLHKLRKTFAFPLPINLTLVKNNHIGRKNIEFTYSQVTTSECIHMHGSRNSFKNDIRLHFNCEIYIFGT